MYKIPNYSTTLIKCNRTKEGETIEQKVKRLVENKEPIKDGSPIIYTDRAEGVNPAFNIRTDRFELATEAMDKVYRSKKAQRDEIAKPKGDAKVIDMKDGGAEPTDGKADGKTAVK